MTHYDIRLLGSVFLIASIVLGALGQLFMRVGMNELHSLLDTDTFQILLQSASPKLIPVLLWTAAGITAYVSSLGCWMITLKKYELSFAYPMLSVSYLLVYAGAVYWPALNESMSTGKTAGILTIITGIVFVTHSTRK